MTFVGKGFQSSITSQNLRANGHLYAACGTAERGVCSVTDDFVEFRPARNRGRKRARSARFLARFLPRFRAACWPPLNFPAASLEVQRRPTSGLYLENYKSNVVCILSCRLNQVKDVKDCPGNSRSIDDAHQGLSTNASSREKVPPTSVLVPHHSSDPPHLSNGQFLPQRM